MRPTATIAREMRHAVFHTVLLHKSAFLIGLLYMYGQRVDLVIVCVCASGACGQ